jgi:hypothetical protein
MKCRNLARLWVLLTLASLFTATATANASVTATITGQTPGADTSEVFSEVVF